MFLNVVLYHPEMPANTGNIIRLCANSGSDLHLIEPLAFYWDDRRLRRAGLDYHEFTRVIRHASWQAFYSYFKSLKHPNLYALSSKTQRSFYQAQVARETFLLFGNETSGLGQEVYDDLAPEVFYRIPMHADSRCLNLSNSVAICVYEGLRQLNLLNDKSF